MDTQGDEYPVRLGGVLGDVGLDGVEHVLHVEPGILVRTARAVAVAVIRRIGAVDDHGTRVAEQECLAGVAGDVVLNRGNVQGTVGQGRQGTGRYYTARILSDLDRVSAVIGSATASPARNVGAGGTPTAVTACT